MLLPVLASAFVGGIIGYSTNWLAIRMLFRPLTEKYIGPFHIPFTPGLIPKKRAALAKSLGNTVADYLVTTDTLVAALDHPDFTDSLERLLGDVWAKLASNQQPLQQLVHMAGIDSQVAALPEQLTEQLLMLLDDEPWLSEFLPQLRSSLCQSWKGCSPGQEQQDSLGECLTASVGAILTSERVRAKFFAQLQQLIADKQADETTSLADILPLTLQEQVHNLILTDAPNWLDWLHRQLQTPASRALVQSFIHQFLAGSTLLKLVSAFADTGKLADALIQSLQKDEVRTQITSMLLTSWERLLKQPVAQLAARIDIEQLGQRGSHLLTSTLQPDWLAQIKNILWQSIKLEDGNFAGDAALTLRLEALGQRALQLVLQSPATRQAITSLLDHLLTRLLEATPESLLASFDLVAPAAIAPRLQKWLLAAATAYGPELLQALRLTEVVEAQVNALGIVQVEEILLQVMREQLSAITNLGFLLGALIGTIMPFINQLLGS